MPQTLIQLARDICDDPAVNLEPPATLFGAYNEGDVTDRRILAAIRTTCRNLASRYDWQALHAPHTFTSVDGFVQPSGLPADFLRMVPDTFWVSGLPVQGPLDAQTWAAIQAGRQAQVWPAFYIAGGVLSLWPRPGAGQSLSFTYIRDGVGRTPTQTETDGSPKHVGRFVSDQDTTYWPDELIRLGAVYQYRKAIRQDYAQEERDFELYLSNTLRADGGGRRIISMNPTQQRLRHPAVTLIAPTPPSNT